MSTYSLEIEDSVFEEIRRALQCNYGASKKILTLDNCGVLKELFLIQNPRYITNPYDYRERVSINKIKGE